MPTARSDLLPVCNDQNVPLDQFKLTFCDRCMQEECTRSRVGTSRFEKRVSNWYQDLFANPPQLDPSDARFEQIKAQKFFMIDTGPVPEVNTSNWADPRDLTEGAAAPRIAAPPMPSAPKMPSQTASEVATPKLDRTAVKRLPTLNTVNQGPKMVGSAVAPTPKSPTDPWAAPTPVDSSTGEVLSEPGAKVQFGGGSSGV